MSALHLRAVRLKRAISNSEQAREPMSAATEGHCFGVRYVCPAQRCNALSAATIDARADGQSVAQLEERDRSGAIARRRLVDRLRERRKKAASSLHFWTIIRKQPFWCSNQNEKLLPGIAAEDPAALERRLSQHDMISRWSEVQF